MVNLIVFFGHRKYYKLDLIKMDKIGKEKPKIAKKMG